MADTNNKTPSETPGADREEILRMTAEITSAYASNNEVGKDDLIDVIKSVYQSLSTLDVEAEIDRSSLVPAVPIKKSIQNDYIVCLEDGKKLKMLKRYLRSNYNMTPEEYRTKWQLPVDYPVVAPSYAKRRSDFAKEFGLGRKRKSA
jgi:MucR family transcriptional regulator, transcriptional regulator of exopolysaccharide biosynthesis